MSTEKHFPEISAKNAIDFGRIEKKINTLPNRIISQIKSARDGAVGIECTIDTEYRDKMSVVLPRSVTQISNFGDYIGIYCGEFFFKIEKGDNLKEINYIILTDEETEYYSKEKK